MNTPGVNEPAADVRLGFAVALGLSLAIWGLLYLAVASVWPTPNHPDLIVEGESVPHVASLADQPRAQMPTRTKRKAKRQNRPGPSLAVRVLRSSTSLN
jgi:hypothetical protein